MNRTIRNASRPVLQTLLALALILTMSAFRHTDVEGYTDPDFVGFKFQTVVLHLPNASLEFKRHVVKRLTKSLRKLGVRVLLHDDLFAPTREWDEASSAAIYDRNGVDAGIVITVGSKGTKETPGMVLYNARTIGGVTTGHATQTTFVHDYADFEIAIVDTKSRRTVWIGGLSTRGSGLLFVGPKSTSKGLVKGLMREWKQAGHID